MCAAAALLAAGIAGAFGQAGPGGTGTGTGAGAGAGGSTAEGQCWDEAMKQVRSKTPSPPSGATTGTQPGTTGAAPTGTPSPGPGAGTRPAGMPNC